MTARTKFQEQEEKKDEIPMEETEQVRKPRKIKSRRVIRLMFSACPLCGSKITKTDEVQEQVKSKHFNMVQFGANPDGTGYESYFCGQCQKFMMMIISPTPIFAQANFTTGMGGQQRQQQQQGPPEGQPQQDGNGQGRYYRVRREDFPF